MGTDSYRPPARKPYEIGISFNRDTLPSPDGPSEPYLIVNYETPANKFWIAYRAEAMAEYLTKLIPEIGAMGGDYTDTVMGAITEAVVKYRLDAEERLLKAIDEKNR